MIRLFALALGDAPLGGPDLAAQVRAPVVHDGGVETANLLEAPGDAVGKHDTGLGVQAVYVGGRRRCLGGHRLRQVLDQQAIGGVLVREPVHPLGQLGGLLLALGVLGQDNEGVDAILQCMDTALRQG